MSKLTNLKLLREIQKFKIREGDKILIRRWGGRWKRI